MCLASVVAGLQGQSCVGSYQVTLNKLCPVSYLSLSSSTHTHSRIHTHKCGQTHKHFEKPGEVIMSEDSNSIYLISLMDCFHGSVKQGDTSNRGNIVAI